MKIRTKGATPFNYLLQQNGSWTMRPSGFHHHWIRVALLLCGALTGLAQVLPARAADTSSCRFQAGGRVGQTVSITVPPAARNATVSVVVDGNPDKSGSTTYTRAQLMGLNSEILARQAQGDAGYMSSPENQVTCMTRMVSKAVDELNQTWE